MPDAEESFYWEAISQREGDSLKGVLTFLNTDLNTTRPPERLEKWINLAKDLFGLVPVSKRGILAEVLSEFPDNTPPGVPCLGQEVDFSFLASTQLRGTLMTIQDVLSKTLTDICEKKYALQDMKTLVFAYVGEEGQIRIYHIGKALESIVVLHFFQLLKNMNVSRIRRCQECGAYFLGRPNTRFCSRQCGWRLYARERREADPEAYREKQKKIMWQRYKEKVRKEVGPNAVVKRRKYYRTGEKAKQRESDKRTK